jgi:hypothetical protein
VQDVPGGNINILGGHNIGHSNKKCICASVLLRTVSEMELIHCTVHCTLHTRPTCHVLTGVVKLIHVDGGIFENVLY